MSHPTPLTPAEALAAYHRAEGQREGFSQALALLQGAGVKCPPDVWMPICAQLLRNRMDAFTAACDAQGASLAALNR